MVNVEMTVREVVDMIGLLGNTLNHPELRERMIKALEVLSGEASTSLTLHSFPSGEKISCIKIIRAKWDGNSRIAEIGLKLWKVSCSRCIPVRYTVNWTGITMRHIRQCGTTARTAGPTRSRLPLSPSKRWPMN